MKLTVIPGIKLAAGINNGILVKFTLLSRLGYHYWLFSSKPHITYDGNLEDSIVTFNIKSLNTCYLFLLNLTWLDKINGAPVAVQSNSPNKSLLSEPLGHTL